MIRKNKFIKYDGIWCPEKITWSSNISGKLRAEMVWINKQIKPKKENYPKLEHMYKNTF